MIDLYKTHSDAPYPFAYTDGDSDGDSGDGDGDDNKGDGGDQGDGDGGSDDDFLNELLLEIDDDDDPDDKSDKDKKDGKDKDKKKSAGDAKNFDSLTTELKDLKSQVSKLWTDKNDLKTALHQARQKAKGKDGDKDDTTILSDDQILKIMKENKDDPKTMLDVVKHLARTEAKKTSGKEITDAAMKGKKSDLDSQLYSMYPALKDDSSKLRGIVDSTVDYYNLSNHPCGEAAAMGIHLLGVLPDLLKSAEEKGLKGRKDSKADKGRKDDINNNKRHGDKGIDNKKGDLSKTQVETSSQLNLTKSQKKIFGSLSGKKGPASVSVNE